MLTLSAGSSCDVCFERFGRDLKAPCSIICGHVFCFDCVSHVNRLCPLCRTHFEPSSCIKLHLDVDTNPQSEQAPGSPSEDEREAQRLHQAINKVADTGIEEEALKQLIQEGKEFLNRQPRHMYKDVRNSLRIIAYTSELKHTLLGQRQMNEEINDEVQRLSTEKSELLKKLVEADEQRKYERETALAVETSLREHYALATRNYQVLIQ
ncbi:hypothetical protein CPB83DRAFT_768874 [Crepidotus variabilis]|uniref:RING-type domain-containing protein n=1 Tax=Crepidotus variabilis TaxID=179855 RepID=A0A9P6JP10_9AGAR|nr:hypothetical protein CPB83DRAFT_768874 [Crepidotus variabilis]